MDELQVIDQSRNVQYSLSILTECLKTTFTQTGYISLDYPNRGFVIKNGNKFFYEDGYYQGKLVTGAVVPVDCTYQAKIYQNQYFKFFGLAFVIYLNNIKGLDIAISTKQAIKEFKYERQLDCYHSIDELSIGDAVIIGRNCDNFFQYDNHE
jgi:hypothetical protein